MAALLVPDGFLSPHLDDYQEQKENWDWIQTLICVEKFLGIETKKKKKPWDFNDDPFPLIFYLFAPTFTLLQAGEMLFIQQ